MRLSAQREGIFRDETAVSPTIATITLVAIAVVLSATLYTATSGLAPKGHATTFPPLVLRDHTEACSVSSVDALFVLEHRGGDLIRWVDYRVHVLEGVSDHAPLMDWGAGNPGVLPISPLAVPGKLVARESTDLCTAGAPTSLMVRVLDLAAGTIVYEADVLVR